MPRFVDDLGEPVWLASSPQRVVSLVPSLTETVAVSAAGRLVGVTDYCTHPAGLGLPSVGGTKYPTLAAVVDKEPDLVLANSEENRPSDVEWLRAQGITVWVTAAPLTVPAALESLRRLLTGPFGLVEPDWLHTAARLWDQPMPRSARALVPVWRKPWVVLGSDTFAGDVLRRLGVANVYADAAERYPRPTIDELRQTVAETPAELLVLPDEPYEFTDDDGPGFFPGTPYVLVPGRFLTWYGPSLVEAHRALATAFGDHVNRER